MSAPPSPVDRWVVALRQPEALDRLARLLQHAAPTPGVLLLEASFGSGTPGARSQRLWLSDLARLAASVDDGAWLPIVEGRRAHAAPSTLDAAVSG